MNEGADESLDAGLEIEAGAGSHIRDRRPRRGRASFTSRREPEFEGE